MFYPLLTWKAFPRPLSSRSSVRQFPPPKHAAKHVTFCSIRGYIARRPTQWTQHPYTGMHQLKKSVQPLKATKEIFFLLQSKGVCLSCFRFFCSYGLLTSVVDLHRFDADPDPDLTFHHFDAGPDTSPDPTISSTLVRNFYCFLFTALLVYIVLSF